MAEDTHFGIVIKKGGVVPFDEGLAPEHKRAIMGHLIEMGHTLEHFDEPHPVHGGLSHVVLTGGPHSQAEKDKADALAAKPS